MKTLLRPINFIYVLLALIGIVACGAPSQETGSTELSAADQDAQAIEALRDAFDGVDKSEAGKAAEDLEALYLQFSVDHKKDERTPGYLYDAALLNERYLDDFDEAFLYYSSLTDDYPESEPAKKAMFMKGMIMSEYYKKCDKAIYYFDEFIRTYPDHELAGMAKDAIEVCGLSAEEIFERIQKNDSL